MSRAVALVLIAVGLVFWPAAMVPARAAQGYEGVCTDSAGITVVVDFQELGGGVNVRCATGEVTSGLDALDKADIGWQGTLRFPGVVCRIAGQPTPDADACVNTPPATAYWSYWVAARGGSWCYSTLGAGNRKPPPGTVEGWSFVKNHTGADTTPPGYDPPPPPDGEPAHPLNPTDCSGTIDTVPATTTTTASTTTTLAAAPTTTSAPVATSPPTAATAAPSAPAVTAAPGTTTAVPPSSTTGVTTAVAATGSDSPSSTTTSIRQSTTTSPASGPTSTARALGNVDLSNNGQRAGGLSAFTVVAIVVLLLVVGTGVVVARRRRGAPS